MHPELGLVCITRSDALRYRTVTRTRLRAATPAARTALLRAIYAANVATLARAPRFCIERGIRLYRIPSGIFPFADDVMGAPLLETIVGELGAIGRAAAALGVRLVMHPNQFVVLNSESEAVVAQRAKGDRFFFWFKQIQLTARCGSCHQETAPVASSCCISRTRCPCSVVSLFLFPFCVT